MGGFHRVVSRRLRHALTERSRPRHKIQGDWPNSGRKRQHTGSSPQKAARIETLGRGAEQTRIGTKPGKTEVGG